MTVQFDAVGPSTSGKVFSGVSSTSWTHTPVSGAITGVIVHGVASVISSATYGGINMPLVGSFFDSNSGGTHFLYALASPPTGPQTVAMSFGGASAGSAASITVTRGDPATVIRAVSSGNKGSTGTPITDTACVSSANDLMVSSVFCGGGGSSFLPIAGGTKQWFDSISNSVGGETAPGAVSVTMTATQQVSGIWSIFSGSFKSAQPTPTGIVVFDAVGPNSSGQQGTSVPLITWTHTPVDVPSAVAVQVAISGTPFTGSVTVTYGGVNMLNAVDITNPTVTRALIFGLASPPPGYQNIVVTFGSSVDTVSAGSISVTGSDPYTCFSFVGPGGFSRSSEPADTCSNNFGDLVIACGSQRSTFPFTTLLGATMAWGNNHGAGSYISGSGFNQLMVFDTGFADFWACASAAFKSVPLNAVLMGQNQF